MLNTHQPPRNLRITSTRPERSIAQQLPWALPMARPPTMGFSLWSVASLLAVLPLGGYAQELPRDVSMTIDEVVVTARKREESAQDVPESLFVLGGEQMREGNIVDLNDVGLRISNINLNRRQDEAPNVTIRGVGSFGNVQGVGFYVDGAQAFTGLSTRLEDVERVEVLKGPQGTLYGGSNIAGVIRFIYNRPQDELNARFTGEFGEQDRLFGSAIVNSPLLAGKLNGRAVLYYEEDDGFTYSPTLRQSIDQKQEIGARLSLSATPTEDLNLLFALRLNSLESGGANIYYRTGGDNDYRTIFDYNDKNFIDQQLYAPYLELSYSLSDVAVTSITAYTNADRDFFYDHDFGPSPDFRTIGRSEDKTLSQEFRLASDEDGAFDWVLGLYGAWLKFDQDSTFNILNNLIYQNGDTSVFEASPTLQENELDQLAAFASASYRFSPKWELSLGLRVDNSKETIADLLTGLRGEKKGTEVMPKLSLAHDVTERIMAYGTYARGFEPGGVDFAAGTAVTSEPEYVDSIELGLKSSLLDGRLQLNAAAFLLKNKDRLFETIRLDPTLGVVEAVSNIGDSTNIGVELDAVARLTEHLTATVGAGWIDAEWDRALWFDPAVGTPVDFGGFKAPFVPAYSTTIGLDWRRPITAGIQIAARADASFVGRSYWDIPNRFQQRAYQIVNARLALVGSRWEIAVRADNLFDEKYNTEFYPDLYIGAFGEDLAARGQPRVLAMSFQVSL